MNNLSCQHKVRLTLDQEKALKILKSKGFNKSKFIRAAIEEKLHRDYRKLLISVSENNKRIPNAPGWLYD